MGGNAPSHVREHGGRRRGGDNARRDRAGRCCQQTRTAGKADRGREGQGGTGVLVGADERRITDHDLLVTPYLGSKAQKTLSFHSEATSQLITGLSDGRSCTFRVAAHNAVGTGKQSVASNAVTIGGGTPGAPSILSVAAGNGQATLSWQAPASGSHPITSYIVTPYAGSQAQPAQSFHSNATAEVVTGLTNSHTYSFRVAAHNAAGTGPQPATSNSVEPTSAPSLSVPMNTTLGKQIIVNAYGQTLYLYTPDGSSTTTKASPGLLSVWPAVA